MTPLIAVLFAVMQGATELFPPFSLGHVVIVPKLLHHSAAMGWMFGLAAVVAYLSTAFLMKYFRDHDRWAMGPFAVLSLVLLSAGI